MSNDLFGTLLFYEPSRTGWRSRVASNWYSGSPQFGRFGTGPKPRGFMEAKELVGVIALAKTLELVYGTVTLLSLEIYDDGSILRLRVRVKNPRTPDLARLRELRARQADNVSLTEAEQKELRLLHEPEDNYIQFRAEDDLGTDYFCMTGAGNGSGDRWQRELIITPGIPQDAKVLRVQVADRALPGADWQPENSVTETVEIPIS